MQQQRRGSVRSTEAACAAVRGADRTATRAERPNHRAPGCHHWPGQLRLSPEARYVMGCRHEGIETSPRPDEKMTAGDSASSSPSSIEEQFEAALAHAQLSPEKVKLWMVPTPPQSPSARAAWYYPRFEIREGPGELLRGDQREEANSAQHQQRHRLAVRTDFDLTGPTGKAILGGLIRHELEHAIQWEVWGRPLFELDQVTDELIDWKAGPPPGEIPLYRRKPREEDANAAAADFVRQAHADVAEALANGEFAELTRSNHPPPDPDTLLVRTVCFQFLYWDLACGMELEEGVSGWAEHIDSIAPGAGDIWRALEQALPPRLQAR
jgi:hypothetical protein